MKHANPMLELRGAAGAVVRCERSRRRGPGSGNPAAATRDPATCRALSSNVGSIPSSFEERVTFKPDSSQFATEPRIFAVEGTGILSPEVQREQSI